MWGGSLKEKVTYSPKLQYLMKLWQRATDSNDVKAQFYLACCFVKSEKNSTQKKPFAFFKKLANQERWTALQTDAQYMLAYCYENGYGVTKSYKQAIKWYEKAYINANNDIYEALEEKINEELDAVLDNPDNSEITSELFDCITETAECGDVDSQKYLMELYQFGSGCIEANDEKVAYWAERAAENGDSEAMCKIGNMYLNGRGVKQNCKKALYWLEKATAQGEADAACSIGYYYNLQKQYKTAAKWYRTGAELRIDWRNKKLGVKTAPLTASDLFNNNGRF